MFLNRIKSKDSGILLYGITPPKSQTAPEKVSEIAEKTLARLHGLDIDALIVYDVQDESALRRGVEAIMAEECVGIGGGLDEIVTGAFDGR